MERGQGARGGAQLRLARVVQRRTGQILLQQEAVRDLGATRVDVVQAGRDAEWREQRERVGFVDDLLVAGGDLLRAGGDAQHEAPAGRSRGGEVVEVVLALRERRDLDGRLEQLGSVSQVVPCRRQQAGSEVGGGDGERPGDCYTRPMRNEWRGGRSDGHSELWAAEV